MTQEAPQCSDSGATARAWRGLEAAALVCYVLVCFAHLTVIPPGGAPDETEHHAYVYSIARHGRLPALPESELARESGRVVTPEAQQPPLYYLLMAPLWLAVGGHQGWFLLIARALSILIGLAAILITRRALRTIMPDRPAALALFTVFACTFGTYNYVMATLNNEVLAVLVFAAGLYFGARAIVADRPLWPILALGAAIGVALLTKLTATALLAVLIVAALGTTAREPGARRWLRALGLVAAAAGVAAAVGGWWLVRNSLVYGQPAPRAHYRPNFWHVSEAFGLPELTAAWSVAVTEAAVRSVWSPEWLVRQSDPVANRWIGHYVGVHVGYGNPVPSLIPLALVAVGVWGAVRLAGREARAQGAATPLVWLLWAVAGGWVWLLAGLTSQVLLVDRHICLFVGRYLPVVLPSLGIVLGVGVAELVPERRRLPTAVALLLLTAGYGLRVLLAVAAKHAS